MKNDRNRSSDFETQISKPITNEIIQKNVKDYNKGMPKILLQKYKTQAYLDENHKLAIQGDLKIQRLFPHSLDVSQKSSKMFHW